MDWLRFARVDTFSDFANVELPVMCYAGDLVGELGPEELERFGGCCGCLGLEVSAWVVVGVGGSGTHAPDLGDFFPLEQSWLLVYFLIAILGCWDLFSTPVSLGNSKNIAKLKDNSDHSHPSTPKTLVSPMAYSPIALEQAIMTSDVMDTSPKSPWKLG